MIHVMYGLPASGKTTLAMKLFETYCEMEKNNYDKKKIVYANLDVQDRKIISNKTDYGRDNRSIDILIVDGFFKSTIDLVNRFDEYFKYFSYVPYDEIVIHVFNQDIQACMNNDMKRNRENKASNSIMQGIEEFNIDTFKTLFCKDYYRKRANILIENEKVIDYSDKVDFTIYSVWQIGNDISNEFEELDEWLKQNHPTVTFLQYKQICKYIKEEEQFTWDYYDKHDTRSIRRSIIISDIERCLA